MGSSERKLTVSGRARQSVEHVEFMTQPQLREPGRDLLRWNSVQRQLPRLASPGLEGNIGRLDRNQLGL